MMLTEIFNNLSPEQASRPQYHNKDNLVSNLCLLLKKLHEVHIDPCNGTLKYWNNEASDKIY